MSHQNEEEFDMEEYVVAADPEKNTSAKKPKLSAKHESLMVFGFWFVQQLGLEGEEKERAYALLKLKGVDVPEQTEFYGSFTDKAAIHKAELRTFVKVPKVRKPRAPRKPKVDPAALELVQMALEPKEGVTPNAKKPRAPRKTKAKPAAVEEKTVEEHEEEDEFQPMELAPLGSVDETVSSEPMAEPVSDPVSEPKKRGRKPKAVATMEPDDGSMAEETVAEEVEPKPAKKRVAKAKK
jgi:hypothetical protein